MKILIVVIVILLGYVAWKEIKIIKKTVLDEYYSITSYMKSKIDQAKAWASNLLK